jgi:hypothetical protein
VAVFTDTVEIDIVGFGVDALTREDPEASLLLVANPGNITASLRMSGGLVSQSVRPIEVSQVF